MELRGYCHAASKKLYSHQLLLALTTLTFFNRGGDDIEQKYLFDVKVVTPN
jgi:hypothetical protein